MFAEQLLNQKDPAGQKFNGVMMEYGDDWQREFTKFLCRCAREAHHKGYTMFGVHEHGNENRVATVEKGGSVRSYLKLSTSRMFHSKLPQPSFLPWNLKLLN